MIVDPATRSANRWLFIGLIAFAIVLWATVLLWMRIRTERKGGKVYPPASLSVPAGARSTVFASSLVFATPLV